MTIVPICASKSRLRGCTKFVSVKSWSYLRNLYPSTALVGRVLLQSSRSRDDYLHNTPLHTPFGTLFSQPQRVKIVGGKHVTRADEPFVPR